jgi:hypothetical protein
MPRAMTVRMYQVQEQGGVLMALHLYAGQDPFVDQGPLLCEAIPRYLAARMAETTS